MLFLLPPPTPLPLSSSLSLFDSSSSFSQTPALSSPFFQLSLSPSVSFSLSSRSLSTRSLSHFRASHIGLGSQSVHPNTNSTRIGSSAVGSSAAEKGVTPPRSFRSSVGFVLRFHLRHTLNARRNGEQAQRLAQQQLPMGQQHSHRDTLCLNYNMSRQKRRHGHRQRSTGFPKSQRPPDARIAQIRTG